MSKIEEAKAILKELGLKPSQQNEISALTLLALCQLQENDEWKNAVRKSLTVTKGIMSFIETFYNKKYAPNTRETFRRQVLHQFVQAGIVDYNPDSPDLPVNSPSAHYAISNEALKVVQSYKSRRWKRLIYDFLINKEDLNTRKTSRNTYYIPVKLSNGAELLLSPGEHNRLQEKVINHFTQFFAKGSEIIYVSDTENKDLYIDKNFLLENDISLDQHGKMPDLLFFDKIKEWLYLIEVVTSHGPMSQKRVNELSAIFSKCSAGKIYISAFNSFTEFRKHLSNIAWDTEVWIAEYPEHLIHYNGDRFIGPR